MNELLYDFEALSEKKGTFLLIDDELRIIYLSSSAKDITGGALLGSSIRDHLTTSDSFRLENFIKSRGNYGEISQTEVSLSHLGGFCFGYVSRRDFFRSPLAKVDLFTSKREFLLSKNTPGAYFGARPGLSEIFERLESARAEAEKISRGLSIQSESISSTLDMVMREFMSAYLVQTVFEDNEKFPVFDLCSATELALRNVAEESGCKVCFCEFTQALLRGKCSRVRITAENLISLISAVFFFTRSLSCEKVSFLADLSEKGEFTFSASASCPSVCSVLPDRAGLIELDSLVEGKSFHLFLCNLICTQFGCSAEIYTKGGKLTITFTVPPVRDEEEFKSRDMVSVSKDHLKICARAFSLSDRK